MNGASVFQRWIACSSCYRRVDVATISLSKDQRSLQNLIEQKKKIVVRMFQDLFVFIAALVAFISFVVVPFFFFAHSFHLHPDDSLLMFKAFHGIHGGHRILECAKPRMRVIHFCQLLSIKFVRSWIQSEFQQYSSISFLRKQRFERNRSFLQLELFPNS
jgi:hypothetical protein